MTSSVPSVLSSTNSTSATASPRPARQPGQQRLDVPGLVPGRHDDREPRRHPRRQRRDLLRLHYSGRHHAARAARPRPTDQDVRHPHFLSLESPDFTVSKIGCPIRAPDEHRQVGEQKLNAERPNGASSRVDNPPERRKLPPCRCELLRLRQRKASLCKGSVAPSRTGRGRFTGDQRAMCVWPAVRPSGLPTR